MGQVIQTDRTLAAVAVTQIFLSAYRDKKDMLLGKCLSLFKGSQIERLSNANATVGLSKYLREGAGGGGTVLHPEQVFIIEFSHAQRVDFFPLIIGNPTDTCAAPVCGLR